MTTDRDNQRVSDAYRDIATQTTSSELDERILQLAADGVRSRYGSARAWTRPLAWAAMIVLSLAVVLEFTRVDVPLEAPEERAEPAVEESARSDVDMLKIKEEKDRQQNAAKRAPAMPAAASFEMDDAAMLREAEDQALGSSARTPCDDEARSAPETWYACIEDLREQGLEAEATVELEALRQAFPDFEFDDQ